MIARFEFIARYFLADWKTFLGMGATMVCAISVLIGLLKPLVYNKIKYKHLRRTCLALSNVFLCLVATAILFGVEKYNFDYYWGVALATSVFSIVCYWCYENFYFRDAISVIGKFTLKKLSSVVLLLINKEQSKNIEKEFEIAKKQIKETLSFETKKVATKIDKELQNL